MCLTRIDTNPTYKDIYKKPTFRIRRHSKIGTHSRTKNKTENTQNANRTTQIVEPTTATATTTQREAPPLPHAQ